MKSIRKLLTIGLTTAALSSFSFAAQAWEPTFYAGGNLGTAQHKQHTYDHHFTILSLEAVGGINLLPYLSVEARLGAGYNEDRNYNTITEVQDDLRENYHASFFLRPGWKNETSGIYMLLGATSTEVSSNAAHLEDSDTGAAYGVGVSFKMADKVDLTAEYKKLKTDNMDIMGGSVGFVYNF